jgi:ATP-binding cassette subfamily F protein 3
MAKMLVSPANFLLLDEPTNHLDLRAKDVLLEAIAEFSGTVLFVSHDRYFIDGLATRVFEVEDRRVHIYPGGYEDYLYRKQGGEAAAQAATVAVVTHGKIDAATGMLKPVKQIGATKPSAPSKDSGGPSIPTVSSSEWVGWDEPNGEPALVTPTPKPVKRLNPIKLKHLEDRVAELEAELPDLEARIQAAEEQQAIFTTAEAAQALAAEVETLREQHAVRSVEWEELTMQLEEQTTA